MLSDVLMRLYPDADIQAIYQAGVANVRDSYGALVG